MFQHGLLFLAYKPSQISAILPNVGTYLRFAKNNIAKTLYVSVQAEDNLIQTAPATANKNLGTKELLSIIPRLYVEAHKFVPLLDVRILHSLSLNRRSLAFQPDILFTNQSSLDSGLVKEFYSKHFITNNLNALKVLPLDGDNEPETELSKFDFTQISDNIYDNVCLGGTFDNLHNGHKIMLSTALIKCSKSLTIGVTDKTMVKNKKLWQLIADPQVRIKKLRDFLEDVHPQLNYNIVPISDPFGPAIVDESLEAIVVSEETKRGGEKINEIRKEKNMPALEIETIGLLDDEHREAVAEENKVSSSSLRMRKLGTLLREPIEKPHLPTKPYIIGLTGVIASGKSSVANKFQQLGAGVVNVDAIAHHVYSHKDKPAYKEIVKEFGDTILDAQGAIDRKKLGELVFNDSKKLQKLNTIVWPRVEEALHKAVTELSNKHDVVVLEVALLFEANLQDRMHQIWLTILDEDEVIRRLKNRNDFNEDDARKRISSMMPVHEKIAHADVIFCTNWDEDVTWQQVHRAWNILMEQLKLTKSKQKQ